jgi:hypothetical protein
MTPARIMKLDDLVADLDDAHDVLLDFIEAAEDYNPAADDALAAVNAAASYLFALRCGQLD